MTKPERGEIYEAIGKRFPEWKGCVAVATGEVSPGGGYPRLVIMFGAPKGWEYPHVGAFMEDWALLRSPDET